MQPIKPYLLLAALALADPVSAQTRGPQPRIREIATIPGVEVEAAAQLPNGRVVLYVVGDSILAYDLTSRRSTFLTRGWSAHIRISPAGDRVAFTSYTEAGDDFIMSMPIDPQTGLATGRPQRVSLSMGDEPSFSPDGKLIAFGIQGPGRSQDLAVVPRRAGRNGFWRDTATRESGRPTGARMDSGSLPR
jgi:hypothetical protein